MYIYSVRIYSNCTSTRAGEYGTLVAEYLPNGTGFKETLTGKQYNAIGSVETAPENAKEVIDLYVGVNNTAKKVIKGYIGDSEGKAKIFWPHILITSFTNSSVIPTFYASVTEGTAANTKSTATNSYGTWTVYVDKPASSSSTTISKAFDSSLDTYCYISRFNVGSSNPASFYLELPSGVSIRPATIITKILPRTETQFLGYNPDTNSWESLTSKYESPSPISKKTVNIGATKYYTKFAWDIYDTGTSTTSNGVQAYDLTISSGDIKQIF